MLNSGYSVFSSDGGNSPHPQNHRVIPEQLVGLTFFSEPKHLYLSQCFLQNEFVFICAYGSWPLFNLLLPLFVLTLFLYLFDLPKLASIWNFNTSKNDFTELSTRFPTLKIEVDLIYVI